jgi:HEPN domain-containing protein
MTHYFKNSRMTELFTELGIEITKENRDCIDELIHDMLSVDYPNSAAAWKMIRAKLSSDDAEGFKQRLKETILKLGFA